MSELLEKQFALTRMIPKLLAEIHDNGYECTFGDAWARDGHMKNSLHYIRLAIDINLFLNGKYLTKCEDHEQFGIFWESIGGTWGGRFGDANHYSIKYENRK